MMRSEAASPSEYIKSLPPDHREIVASLRRAIQENLPEGYEEVMQYGMISYVVPLSLYPSGYLGKRDTPLPYISLASQKNYVSLYLLAVYADKERESWFKAEYAKTGKRLDMGKSCVRFKALEDVPLELVGKAAAIVPVKKYVEAYEKGRRKP